MDRTDEYIKENKKAECKSIQLSEEEKNKYGLNENKAINPILKIDPELRDLLPPLTEDAFKGLEKLILKEGCKDAIILWNGYIADGHNRYEICTKYNIPFTIEDLPLIYKEDVKDWMIDHQLGKRNLSLTQISYLRGIQYEREKKREYNTENLKQFLDSTEVAETSPSVKTSQRLAEQHKVSERTIRDDAEFARAVNKIAENVGVEAKNKILNRDIQISKDDVKVLAKMDTETQKKLLVDNEDKKVKIPKSEVKKEQKENPNTVEQKSISSKPKIKECLKCGLEKSLDDFYIGHDKCKDCEQEEIEKRNKNSFTEEKNNIDETIKEVKTIKNVEDCLVVETEIECTEMSCNELYEQIETRFITMINVIDKMDDVQLKLMVDVLNSHIENINILKNKFIERIK